MRREHIVDTAYRIAEAHVRQAHLGLGRAEAARREAAWQIEELEAANDAAEADLTRSGALGGVERELLWAHRAWASRERMNTGERLAITEAQVEAAQARLSASKAHTRVREAARDRVHLEVRQEREKRMQRELDEVAGIRAWRP